MLSPPALRVTSEPVVDSSYAVSDGEGRCHASAAFPLDPCWIFGLHLLSHVVRQREKITVWPKMLFQLQLSDVFLFSPCRHNNTLFSYSYAAAAATQQRKRRNTDNMH